MSEKELGQTAYEAWAPKLSAGYPFDWSRASSFTRAEWAAVETAVRNAALEEAASEADEYLRGMKRPGDAHVVSELIRALKREKTPDAEAPGQ